MHKALDFINSSNNILILTHKSLDGDAVGSVLGLAQALEIRNKNVKCFSKDIVPSVFAFLPKVDIIKNQTIPNHYDLVVLLDCATISRTGITDIGKVASSFDKLLIIDHHPQDKTECDNFENCFAIINEKMSSTSVLVYNLLKEMDVKITKDIANCLLTGIFTDTGGFQHSNTDSLSLRVAAEFMKKGSRIEKIAKNIFNNKKIAAIRLWGLALSRIETNPETDMVISYISKKDMEDLGGKEEDLIGLVNIINTISDAKFSLFLIEHKNNKIKGSLRSEEYKGIDVSHIAKSFGGGGHKLASGFEVDGNFKEGVEKVSEMIKKIKLAN